MAVVEKTIDILGDETLSAFIIAREIPEGNPVDFYDEAVKSLKSYALRGMKGVQSINLPNVTTIGSSALIQCPDLVSISLPACTSFTSSNAVRECPNLETVDLPLLRTVADYSFLGCTKLRSISLPSLQSCSTGIFFGCTLLESVSMPRLTVLEQMRFICARQSGR